MVKLSLYIVSFFTVLFSFSLNNDFEFITSKTEFTAGHPIVLQFSTKTNTTPLLYVSNSFGSTLIIADKNNTVLSYKMPLDIASRAGIINWTLLTKTEQLQGKIKVLPKQSVENIQTYLGPPSIAAGGTDYSMLVAIPTDVYDNPLADNTKVAVTYQFRDQQTVDTIIVNNGISHKTIYSPLKTGRILSSSSCLGFNSKEYTINVMPGPPVNFNIAYKRHHDYADGNQITTFSTSIVKDVYGNTVSDGTYVEFFIKTSKQNIIKTSGTTINGIAVAKMKHPDHANSWSVQAFIEGMAESNRVELEYKSVISNFNIRLSNNNREIAIGPLKSFMGQIIPDGLEVTFFVYSKAKLIATQRKNSIEGYARFKLNPDQFPKGNYTIIVKTAGITKSLEHVVL